MTEADKLVTLSFEVAGVSSRNIELALQTAIGKLGAQGVLLNIEDAPQPRPLTAQEKKIMGESVFTLTQHVDHRGTRSFHDVGIKYVRDLFLWGRKRTQSLRGIGDGRSLSNLSAVLDKRLPGITWYGEPPMRQIVRLCGTVGDVPLFVVPGTYARVPGEVTVDEFLRDFERYKTEIGARDAESVKRAIDDFRPKFNANKAAQ